jgi:hypothetical protein
MTIINKHYLLAILATTCLISTTGMLTQFARAEMSGHPIPFTAKYNKSTGNWDEVTTTTSNSASASRADSASSANSQNNVKCFAFCLGVSNANSGSAANSDSRTNSPGNTATSMPVSPEINSQASMPTVTPPRTLSIIPHDGYDSELTCSSVSEAGKMAHVRNCPGYDGTNDHMNTITPSAPFQQPDNIESLQVIQQQSPTPAATNECIDTTGSVNDEGYHFGYVDAQRGNNDAIHKHGNHTDDWRNGYRDGFAAGQQDKANEIDKNPC